MSITAEQTQKNVLGEPLHACCYAPKTGFFRDGFCRFDERDHGQHTVCIEATEAFLSFSASRGNDLSTPIPEFDFPGLNPGDRWCLCALRWKEALENDMAPPVILEACHESVLNYVSLNDLMSHAVAYSH